MHKRCAAGLLACLVGFSAMAEAQAPRAAEQDKQAFIEDLLGQMTLEEKLGQLNLVSIGDDYPRETAMAQIRAGQVGGMFNTVTKPDIRRMQDQVAHSRLKIPLFYAYDVVHGHRTIFPISLGLAASWDLEAVALSGRVSAIEAAADGLNMTFSPMVDITRDPRWGRVSEGFGEDTYLTSKMSEVMVRAYQGEDPSAPDRIMASVKHFALYGAAEGGRDYNTVDMSPQRMHQDYLPPYKAAVDAGAGGVMVALNAVNGEPATASRWLLRDLLRQQWGFGGVTLSDHGAIKSLIEHGVAANEPQTAKLALEAGIDMNMHDRMFGLHLPGLLARGEVRQADIDQAVRHVLGAKWDMGLFADAYRHLGPASSDPVDTNAEERLHRAESRAVARTAMVLLKNEAQTLPLARQGTLALVGPLADSKLDMIGSWSAAGRAEQAVTLLEGLRNAVGEQARILHARGANISDDPRVLGFVNDAEIESPVDPRPAVEMIEEAVQAARQADVIIAAVGEARGMAHESASRSDLNIPENQRALLRALKATGKPLVLVLMNGRPLTLTWEHENADAILETWFSGTEGGNAIADVLFGDYNPSGKLPMTFPRSVGQVPLYYSELNTGRPAKPDETGSGKYTSRYFDIENGPLYPFGYGLSYTEFSLSPIRLSGTRLGRDGTLTASVTLENTGTREGATVVQLYLQDIAASISRPKKELKGFQKVTLEPGESQQVSFTLGEADLRFFNTSLQWASEPGDFNLYIGLDSQDVQQQRFTLH
ncbi:beta-glucosidase BglX [Stutzerimonas nosocomialis]|uniref:beta-glucosidase BglX n=1 Tax=Stutzerimonas nosocomialis TaxID=1056496 RepID=UPI00110970F9|nr:beta-glucosidase BglX [Stutzerimonas nosocomialis]TLX53096.1 beta-glucosidase BglX [Stutzerimonas nosocomialis]